MREQKTMSGILFTLLLACISGMASSFVFAAEPDNASTEKQAKARAQGPVSLTVDGISVQADDDAPRVLNIVPWQRPTISRRTRNPLPLNAPALLEPVQPEALRRHRTFRRTLDPLAE